MTAPDIDEALRRSDPWKLAPDDPTARTAVELAADARIEVAASGRRRSRRALWTVPVAAIGGLALSAGALLLADNLLRTELPIPIEYTTDSGRTITCLATIEGGSYFAPREDDVVAYYRGRDFTGIGQRIYDYALVLAGEKEATPEVFPRSSTVAGADDGSHYPEESAFSYSLTSFLLLDAILDMGIDGSGDSWLHTDCTGDLH